MKANILILKKSGLLFSLIITVIILVLAMSVTAFSEETGGAAQNIDAPPTNEANSNGETGQQDGAAEAPPEGNASEGITSEDGSFSEPDNSETPLVDESVGEATDGLENVVEPVEGTSTEQQQLFNTATAPVPETVLYNTIYFGGLNIIGNNWDYIEITVTNAKTGVSQQGYLDYRDSSALRGYLTSGSHSDTHNYYKIEARIYMPNGEVTIINGTSTGTAGSGSEYFTISFKAEGNNTITAPGEISPGEIEILDPSVPLDLPESGIKKNPPTSDSQLLYSAIPAILFIALTVCLVQAGRINKKL